MTVATPLSAWRPRLRNLRDRLTASGVLDDPAWCLAFANVPRHVFVPGFYDVGGDEGDGPRWVSWVSDPDAWLDGVYSDDTLPTQLRPFAGMPDGFPGVASSSSTRPSYMLSALKLLDVADGNSVLEIGTGSGYNAALLSERLGDDHVASLDIDPALIDLAGDRLAMCGYRPMIAARDGANGFADHAPYDRVIATVAFPSVPYAWVEQTRPGGVILADIRPAGMIHAGAWALLRVGADGAARGRLVDGGVGYMSARTDVDHAGGPDVPPIDKTTVQRRDSHLLPGVLDDPAFAFAVWLRLPGIAKFRPGGRVLLTTPDGAWCKATTDPPSTVVEYGGGADLWAAVEDVAEGWDLAGRPGLDAYRVTVSAEGQAITRPSA